MIGMWGCEGSRWRGSRWVGSLGNLVVRVCLGAVLRDVWSCFPGRGPRFLKLNLLALLPTIEIFRTVG